MDDILGDDLGQSDGDEEMTGEEMAAFRARMIAKKGCYNYDWKLKEKLKEQGGMDTCATCGKPYALDDIGKGKPLNKCARCLQTNYCSRDCQKSDWKAGHQKVCTKAGHKDKENALKG
ncbi:hypothetical protein LTR70_004039 [Exophiala xenobiotica]|uniref:MYND-type domain-containing protein n=1 Tax=Lithohypha guttulata TaxID=1690604 RepID=A0ABR0KEM5_9EURO|nr:hypothetical protein LTR24_003516 [Lithohypha guttulata]KAK5321649.1 hypothetical protein LTR70_004039 [Exophiala xenobiotica]